MKLFIQKRLKIVFLYLYKLRLKMSFRAIVRELKYSQDTVKIWIDRYQKSGDMQDEEGRGRKRKTSEAEDMNIISIVKKLRTRLSAKISQKETNISLVTVRR